MAHQLETGSPDKQALASVLSYLKDKQLKVQIVERKKITVAFSECILVRPVHVYVYEVGNESVVDQYGIYMSKCNIQHF